MSTSGYARGSDGSHHWYWVAAIPATFVLWLASLAWLAVASTFEAFSFGGSTIRLSMVALGVPFVFLTAYFPVAVYRDASYIDRTSGKWAPEPMHQALTALIGLVLLVAVGGVLLALRFPVDPVWAVIVGFVASVPFAVHYLRRRRERVGVPGLPWR